MENLCNNCIHKDVCSRWTATGGRKSCEHFKEERKKGRWLPQILLGKRVWDCSECKTLGSPHWIACPVCGADMRGTEDG